LRIDLIDEDPDRIIKELKNLVANYYYKPDEERRRSWEGDEPERIRKLIHYYLMHLR